MSLPPLIVDLDGTLIHTDMLHESALRLVRDNPLKVLKIPVWLASGKANLKRRLAAENDFDAEILPYNEELLAWLKQQRDEGRRLILCTASDRAIAERIAARVGLFDEVLASDGEVNNAGRNKARALEDRFGKGGFDYVGNSSADLAVWASARRAIVVNARGGLVRRAASLCEVEHVVARPAGGLSAWRRMLRIHQWLKNLLLFVPLLAAHEFTNIPELTALLVAFFSFSLCASSVYIANDLLDLESDRLHPRKRARPFASGVMPVWIGVVLAPVLLATSLGLGSVVGRPFLAWLVSYFVLTCAYSWLLKRLVLVDCLTLALLYTVRILAGAATVGHALSFWLLAFSVFLFLSLAFVKRYAELEVQLKALLRRSATDGGATGGAKVHGRGYHTDDASLIQTMGITAGQASVVVLAFYLNSDAVIKLYRHPEAIWGAVPVMLFWVNWMWVQAHRGNMNDDPLVFAVKDRTSLFAGVLFVAVLVAGAARWS